MTRVVGGRALVFVVLAAIACGRVLEEAPPDGSAGAGSVTGAPRGGSESAAGGRLDAASGASAQGGARAVGGAGTELGGAKEEGGANDELGGSTTDFAGAAGAAGAPADVDYSHARWPMPNGATSGLPNPASYDLATPGVVSDRVTGLSWQSDFAPDPVDWPTAVSACTSLSLAGYSDWRLPSRVELVSLFAAGFTWAGGPPPLPLGGLGFWSSSELFGDASQVWTVYPTRPAEAYAPKTHTRNVRCVRTAPSPRPRVPQLIVVPNEVTDTATELAWERSTGADAYGVTWSGASAYCKALRLDGLDDWRLPSIQELASIIDDDRYSPALDTQAFAGDATTLNAWDWAYVDPTGSGSTFIAGNVHSEDGVASNENPDDLLSVRCVRHAAPPTNSP